MALTKVTGQVIKNTTDVTVGVLTVTNTLAVGGTVSIGGTLTYEDVTNVDAVGLITARNGIVVGSGITLSKDGDGFFTGVTTSTTFVGAVTGNVTGNISGGTVAGSTGTFTGDVDIADKIIHTGDTDTAIRFPSADTVSVETGGTERISLSSSGVVINETGAAVDFRVEGDAETNLFLVDASTDRIGVRTNTPSDFFEVAHADNAAGGISITNTNNSQANAMAQLLISGGDSGKGRLKLETNGAFHTIDEDSNGNLIIEDNGSERLRIDSSGRLLINKTSDRGAYYGGTFSGYLQVEGTGNLSRLTQFVHNTNTAAQHILVLGKSRGTSVGSYTVVQNSDYLGTLSFQGADGDAMIEGARIDAIVSGAPGDQDMPTALTFGTTADGASSTTERLRIHSDGKMSLGTSSSASAKFNISHGNELGLYTSGGYNYQAKFESTDAEAAIVIEDSNSTDDANRIGVITNDMTFITNNSERLRIDSSGRVIIGGTSPLTDAQLTISADDAPLLAFQRSGSGKFESAIGMSANSALRFYNGADSSTVAGLSERMQIDASGNVKIGNTATNDLPLDVRRNDPVAGRLLAVGSNGTADTGTASGLSNALVLFRNRVEVAPNTTTDLVSGYGGSLVLITMVNNGGADVQQTRIRTHAWSSSTSLFFNTYGVNQPTVTFSVSGGVLKVNHNHSVNIFFNCAGFIISGPHTG